jgi:hypothetical protein
MRQRTPDLDCCATGKERITLTEYHVAGFEVVTVGLVKKLSEKRDRLTEMKALHIGETSVFICQST